MWNNAQGSGEYIITKVKLVTNAHQQKEVEEYGKKIKACRYGIGKEQYYSTALFKK